MKKQFSQSLISLITLIIMLGKPMCSYAAEISVDTYNHSGPFSIRVIFKDGKYDWAQNILTEAPRYIRMVERYLGIPFAFGNHLTIEGCDNCTSRAEIAQRKIYLDQSWDPLNNPALLFHEINHFWFYYYVNPSNEEWLIEGISSFLPVVMRNLHFLPDEHKYNKAIDQWWGLESLLPNNTKDLPLYPFRESKRQIVYLKSYRVQFIIHCILGEKRYRSFLKKIVSIKRRQPIVVLQLLNSYKKANWRRILSGWVFRGSYRLVALNDFISDEDFDGLSKAKEICFKSSPVSYDTDQDFLPDGAELELGRNPRRLDPDGLELLRQHGPFVDGNDKEWEYFNAISSNDEIGEIQG
ncbi:MAG: M1 family metallopeptidase, partial [SAR324 cluster bacterium]|nr:M1 family metallopeptidase [SAR324 cluster bacterium]